MIQRKKPLARSTKALKRSPLPKATNRPKARKADPAKRRFAKFRDPRYVAWIRTFNCCVPFAPGHPKPGLVQGWVKPHNEGLIEADHVRTRGAGGADIGNLTPMCRPHHDERHRLGIRSFEAKYGVSLKAIALELANRYDREVTDDR